MMQTLCVVFFFQLVSLNGATESGIFGGIVSKPHSRPYMASLQFDGKHSCGGILVRDDFVLTAAHCSQRPLQMMVVLGAHNVEKAEKSQQHLEVAKYFPHPKFTQGTDYDIMLLKLKKKAKLNKFVKPIGLPKKNGKTPANVECVVAGWGRTAPNEPTSHVLRETKEKIQFSRECQHVWKTSFITGHMICTKFDKRKRGVCRGDSGGPLICNSKPQGLVAFTGKKCDDPKLPHVFTNLGFYLPWINEIMRG